MGNPLISVVILNYNGKAILNDCLSSVLASDYPDFEVVLVDNASTDSSLEDARRIFAGDTRLRIISNPVNLFYAGGNNAGIHNAKGDYLLILNNDTKIEKDCLRLMAQAMEDKGIGALQPKILFFDSPGVIDSMGGQMDRFGYSRGIRSQEKDSPELVSNAEIFYAGGAAMMLKKSLLDKVGVFDEDFMLHWEDADLCWRIRLAGYKIFSVPKARVYHKVSQTIKKFGDNHKISFHIRKNRICGMIKNYGLLRLGIYLPAVLLIYLAVFFKELIFDRKPYAASTSFKAVWWNLKNLPAILKKRSFVQQSIRRLPDREVFCLLSGKGFIF